MTAIADIVLTGGKVITVDGRFSIAEAVAVSGDRIAAVGAVAEIKRHTGAETQIIDLAGRTVIPGLIDGHAHMDREGLKSVFPSLAGARSIRDIQDRIAALVVDSAPGDWIVTMPIGEPPNYRGVPENLKEGRFPTRWELDEVAPDNPVYIRPIWGYWRYELPLVSVANSRALEIAGLDRHSQPALESIHYERDSGSGELTGVFLEHTPAPIMELVDFPMMPRFTHDIRVAGLRDSMRVYNRTGTTSVYEGHGVADELIAAYCAVEADRDMTVRARLLASPSWSGIPKSSISACLDDFAERFGGAGTGNDLLSFEGMHAALGPLPEEVLRAKARPYTGWSGFNYDFGLPREGMTDYLIMAAEKGLRIATIGLGLLEHFEAVNKVIPIADRRWVMAHVARATPEEIDRLAALGIVLTIHANEHIQSCTPEKIAAGSEDDIVPMNRMLDAGLHFALSTDNVPPSMFNPLWLSVSRYSNKIDGAVAQGQSISREAALRAATIEGAYLTFEEEEKGSLEPGKLADMAVLSADPLSCSEDALKDITADVTIVGGNIVFERD